MSLRTKIISKFTSPLFTALLNVAMLIIAVLALYVAIKTLNGANEQFRQNSISSDSLFRAQLANSKELNDSLVVQISRLQSITLKQIEITDRQLQVSIETYRAQLYSGRPIISLGAIKLTDDNVINEGLFRPVIQADFTNTGQRFARDLRVRTFLVFPDFSGIRSTALFPIESTKFEKGEEATYHFMPEIPSKYRDEFYFCIEFRYEDDVLRRSMHHAHYFHYHEDRGQKRFFISKDEQKPRIRTTINQNIGLVSPTTPLLDK